MSEVLETDRNEIGTQFALVLTMLPCITGTISVFSSGYLMWSILRGDNFRRPREEILLGLTFLNLLFSAGCAMSTFAGPAELIEIDGYILKGTTATCNFQGWLYQAGTCVPMYNSTLAVYYLLRVKYGISDESLRKRTLPAMHTFVLLFAFGTATAGLFLDIYNFGGMLGCWISDSYQIYCIDGTEFESCDRGSNHELYLWLFGGFPVLASLTCTIFATIMLYCTVRSQEARSYSYGHEQSDAVSRSKSCDGVDEVLQPPGRLLLLARMRRCLVQASQLKISAKVRDSGLLYLCAFWITYLPFLITELCWLAGTPPPNWIRVANVTLLPLQGFFNVIIYKMPRWRYLRSQRNRSSVASSALGGRRNSMFVSGVARNEEPVESQELSPQQPDELSTSAGVPTVANVNTDLYDASEQGISEREGRQRRMCFLMLESSSHGDDGVSEE